MGAAALPVQSTSDAGVSSGPDIEGPVLVVNSNREIAALTCSLLNKAGIKTVPCYSADTALKALMQAHYPAMVVDLMLEDMSGYTLYQACRQAGLTVRAVMTANQGEVHAAVRAVREGLHDFLPGRPDGRLVEAVKGALQAGS